MSDDSVNYVKKIGGLGWELEAAHASGSPVLSVTKIDHRKASPQKPEPRETLELRFESIDEAKAFQGALSRLVEYMEGL